MHELDPDAGKLRFNGLEFPMQVLGTESDNTLIWLWAWADEHTEVPAGLLQSAIELRNWGAGDGCRGIHHARQSISTGPTVMPSP